MIYDPEVYRTPEWFLTLDYTDECNERGLDDVLRLLGMPDGFLDVGCGNGGLVKKMHTLRLGAYSFGIYAMGVELMKDPRWDGQGLIVEHDLREPMDLGMGFDLVVSLEVGEHLPGESAGVYCENLAYHVIPGGWLVFTAAEPGQGGLYHVNEQSRSYWRRALRTAGLTYMKTETRQLGEAWRESITHCSHLSRNVQVFTKPGD